MCSNLKSMKEPMICLSDMDFVIHYVTMSMYNYDLTTCKPSVETVLFLEDYDFKDKVKKVYSKIDQRFNHIFVLFVLGLGLNFGTNFGTINSTRS